MLTIEKVKQNFNINEIQTPAMIIDSSVIREKYNNIKNLINSVEVFYSVKSNPYPKVLELLNELGSGFEVASLQEFNLIKSLGVSADKIIIGNTLKVPKFVEEAFKYGVNYFAVDSTGEIDKIAQYAPGSSVALRIIVDNNGSEWPLSKKFGAPSSEALKLLRYSKEKGLNPNALAFHVGSQCMNATSWSNALMTVAEIYNLAKKEGIKIDIINLGGGFPSKLDKKIPDFQTIKDNINKTIEEVFNGNSCNLKFYVEPGRGMVGEAAMFISTVIAQADRGSERWISLDIGVYNGLLEAVAGIQYEIISDKEYLGGLKKKIISECNGNSVYCNITGPTCDSWDTIIKGYPMQKDVKVGDIIYIMNTGAYTLCETTNFNGFGPPQVYFI